MSYFVYDKLSSRFVQQYDLNVTLKSTLVSDWIEIVTNEDIDQIMVFSIDGKKWIESKEVKFGENINISALTAGTYFCTVTINNKSKTLQIYKE